MISCEWRVNKAWSAVSRGKTTRDQLWVKGYRSTISCEWRVIKAWWGVSGGLAKCDQLWVEGNQGVISCEWRIIKAWSAVSWGQATRDQLWVEDYRSVISCESIWPIQWLMRVYEVELVVPEGLCIGVSGPNTFDKWLCGLNIKPKLFLYLTR